jgi:hypothetical protein
MILEVLISQSEIGDKEWAQAQLERVGRQAQQSLLLTGQGPGREVAQGQREDPMERLDRLREFLGVGPSNGTSSRPSSEG